MLLFCIISFLVVMCEGARPNIVLIIADDLGWNDVGFHGSNEIPTPNIDALAYSGVILQNYYVNPICTPTRSALMTGNYPIHTGMQHSVLFTMERRGLPLDQKLLPEYLKQLDYKTHLVGKWHLGFYKKEYTPLYRGFDSHMGFWSGRIDHFDHTSMENGTWGTDFRRGFKVAHDLFGKYVTDIFTEEAVNIIHAHKKSSPLFLTVSHSAMHSGNPNDPIRAPYKMIKEFSHIKDEQRRKYAAVLTKLDESVGKVTSALDEAGILNNTIIIFTTDNGGAPAGFNDNAGSNWPLRGVKNTLWEGGVRGAGFIWSPLIKKSSRVAQQRIHVADWLPTLYAAAGGNYSFDNIDGVNQWEAISQDLQSNRQVLVHNIDDIWGSASITVDQWKLHNGTNYKGTWDGWYGPDGREGSYDTEQLLIKPAGKTLQKYGLMPNQTKILELRQEATMKCDNSTVVKCRPLEAPCLFDIEKDPCEFTNLAEQFPEVLQNLLKQLEEISATAVPPSNTALDSFGDPKYWSRIYTNFGDYETSNSIL